MCLGRFPRPEMNTSSSLNDVSTWGGFYAREWELVIFAFVTLYNNINISFALFSCTVPRPWTSVADELYNPENGPPHGRESEEKHKSTREVNARQWWIKHALCYLTYKAHLVHIIIFYLRRQEPFSITFPFLFLCYFNEALLKKCWVMIM